MNTYVFSYISFFDHVLTSKVIESEDSILEVARKELGLAEVDPTNFSTLEDIKNYAYEGDSMFEIIKI